MNKIARKELIFQVLLHIVAFLFYAFDKRDPTIHDYEVGFFMNYALIALVINFYVFPSYYKDKNFAKLLLLVVLGIVAAVAVEEFVLEQLFFPDNRGQSTQLFYASLKAVPVITILSGFKFGWDAVHIRNEVNRLKDLARQSELQFLKTQINPHFLFNNLNNLYAYSLEGSEKTPEIILELSGLLRYMLYECKEEYVSLRKEVEQLKNFIDLNELQIEDRGRVIFNEKGINDQFKIAPLILIVFIENAFKHSVSSQSEDIFIEVNIDLQEGVLKFNCKNSYSGNSNVDSLAKGIGLANVTKRLDLIYENQYTLNFNEQEEIYEVNLEINLNNQ